jgi:hypothetical protein
VDLNDSLELRLNQISKELLLPLGSSHSFFVNGKILKIIDELSFKQHEEELHKKKLEQVEFLIKEETIKLVA